jgi:hypothetical protein
MVVAGRQARANEQWSSMRCSQPSICHMTAWLSADPGHRTCCALLPARGAVTGTNGVGQSREAKPTHCCSAAVVQGCCLMSDGKTRQHTSFCLDGKHKRQTDNQNTGCMHKQAGQLQHSHACGTRSLQLPSSRRHAVAVARSQLCTVLSHVPSLMHQQAQCWLSESLDSHTA